MSKPQKKHWKKLKRLARYLVMYPKLVWKFKDDERSSEDWLDVYSDSDWAGDEFEEVYQRRDGGAGWGAAEVVEQHTRHDCNVERRSRVLRAREGRS